MIRSAKKKEKVTMRFPPSELGVKVFFPPSLSLSPEVFTQSGCQVRPWPKRSNFFGFSENVAKCCVLLVGKSFWNGLDFLLEVMAGQFKTLCKSNRGGKKGKTAVVAGCFQK